MIILNDIYKFLSINPSFYRFLKHISFSRNVDLQGCNNYDVEIILSKISEGTTEDLKMRCVSAINIKIGEIESMFGMLLNIENIDDNQIEGVSYRITEQENNTFSFDCRDFSIELID